MLALERPGYGGSGAVEGGYEGRTVGSWAGDVREVVEGLGIGEVAVLVCRVSFCACLR